MKRIKKVFLFIAVMLIIFQVPCLALTPASNEFIEGIDVSNWQGYINYEEVKKAGIEIVYIKASQGNDYKDPYFELNYENAKLNGLRVGVYHYLTARSLTEAEQQARFFASIISEKEIDCKLAMDFEDFGDLTKDEINEISEAFISKLIELTKREIVIYSDLYNARNTFDLSNYPLWIAYYRNYAELENIATNWRSWEGQQYTDMGRVEGINDYVDRNLFTQEILLDDNSKIEKVEASSEKNVSERIEYIVKRGDTLWAISRMYDVSINEIARLNDIANPNLIYPNEKLEIITNSNFEYISGLGKDFYTVKAGDTLSELALKFDTTVEDIVKLNSISNPNLIYVGQRLRI